MAALLGSFRSRGVKLRLQRWSILRKARQDCADRVTVQQVLGHSTVIVTMRYTHTNLVSEKAAVAKLESFGDNLVTVRTKRQQSTPKLSPNAPLRAVARYT